MSDPFALINKLTPLYEKYFSGTLNEHQKLSLLFDINTCIAQYCDEYVAPINKELSETIALLRKECDHDWEFIDDSFDHEFGTEIVHRLQCRKCGETKKAD